MQTQVNSARTGADGARAAAHPVLGDWRTIARARLMRVKGNLVRSRARYVREQYGLGELAELCAQLRGEARAYLEDPPLPSTWCSFGPLMDVDCAIIAGPMRGRMEHMLHFGQTVGRYDLSTIYKMLLFFASPATVLSNTNLAYSLYFRSGSLRGTRTGDEEGRVELSGAVFPRYMCAYGITGWLDAALSYGGGRATAVDHTACVHQGDAACCWDVRWR
ncbi:MAG: hypothetical protein HY904_22270 [Deltaproteobacteria bacterium]|nr:hypothetical protein [Deltaproteobacteria bacterium]